MALPCTPLAARRPLLAAALLVLLGVPGAGALEVDQFLAWEVELEDSTAAISGFVNEGIEKSLGRVNRGDFASLRCEEIPPRAYRYLYSNLISPRLRRFFKSDPRVDRHPGPEVGYWGYLKASVFRRPAFPFIMPLSRTLRVGEVYLGADKLEHMFSMGRRYYRWYLGGRGRGLAEEAAMQRAVVLGMRFEKYLIGGFADGVFSHADLEANFQGLLLARALCEGPRPHLVLGPEGWRLARPVELARYVNPDMDETFNNNHYMGYRWRRIRPILLEQYCPLYRSPEVATRMRRYRERHEPSLSKRLVDAHFAARDPDPRREQALETLCPPRLTRATPAGEVTAGLPEGPS